MMPLIPLTLAQKVVLMVSVPVTGMLLFLLLRRDNEDEDYEEEDAARAQAVVTSRQTVIEVKVPRDAVGAIIGSQGAHIKEIQEQCGARINFKDEVSPDTVERTVVIRGTHDSAQHAEILIQKVIADQPTIVTETVRVPQKSLGRIIGRNGDSIRTMSRVSKARIVIDRSEERDKDGTKEVTIKGSQQAVDMAKSLIEEKLEEERAFRAKLAVDAANRQPRNRAKGGAKSEPDHTPTEGGDSETCVRSQAAESWQSPPQADPPPSTSTTSPSTPSLSECPDYLKVYVSAVEHPAHFWVQVLTSKSTQLDEMIREMTTYYSSTQIAQASQEDKPLIDDIVAAPFLDDASWYRARVLGFQDDNVDLYYVDFGDSELVPRAQVKALRADFFNLPFQAFECSLAHVKPKDSDEWSEESIIAFEDLTYCAKWKVLMSKTVSYTQLPAGDTLPCLKMVDTNGKKDLDIAEELVRRGLADWDLTDDSNTSQASASTSKVAADKGPSDLHAL